MGAAGSEPEKEAAAAAAATPAAAPAAAAATPAAKAASPATKPAASPADPAAAADAAPRGPEAKRMSVISKSLEALGCDKASTKRNWMDHFAVDPKGNVLDQDKHDKACALISGAVDGEGNVVDKDKFNAAAETIAAEGKAKADAKKAAQKEKKAAAGEGKGKKPDAVGAKICVRNLHEDVTQEKLTAMFAPFGTVGRVDVKTKDGGKCKGFGFVGFATKEEADKAMKEMNEKNVDGKKLAVTLAFEAMEKGSAEKGAYLAKGKGKDGKGDGKGMEKGKGKGKQVTAAAMAGYQQPTSAAQYQAYQAQVQQWYAMQMQAAMMAQYQAAQMQGYYGQAMGAEAAAAPTAGAAAPAAGLIEGKKYDGIMKRITQRNGYGFIECPELNGQWADKKNPDGRDIYIAAAMIPPTCTEPGAKVRFTLTLNAKEHPQASSCVAI